MPEVKKKRLKTKNLAKDKLSRVKDRSAKADASGSRVTPLAWISLGLGLGVPFIIVALIICSEMDMSIPEGIYVTLVRLVPLCSIGGFIASLVAISDRSNKKKVVVPAMLLSFLSIIFFLLLLLFGVVRI